MAESSNGKRVMSERSQILGTRGSSGGSVGQCFITKVACCYHKDGCMEPRRLLIVEVQKISHRGSKTAIWIMGNIMQISGQLYINYGLKLF